VADADLTVGVPDLGARPIVAPATESTMEAAMTPSTETTDVAAEPRTVEVKELGHAVLYVRDVARSVAFYGGLLGWRQVAGGEGMPVAAFSSGRTHHELLLIQVGPEATAIPAGRRVGLYHLGLKVGDTDDELRAARAAVESRPDLCTLVGASDHGVTHSLYVHDPDGNEIELFIDVPGVDWRTDPTSVMTPTRPLSL
jgi:catechol 2,3-dioxygenase